MSRLLRKALNVAEKASVARSISKLLNPGCRAIQSLSKFNPVYKFYYDNEIMYAEMYFTSVRGHLNDLLFTDENLKNWESYNPKKLITAETKNILKGDMKQIIENLQNLSYSTDLLILWLDCDLEGEAIAKEVEEACLKANPSLEVKRARFSALTKSDVGRAATNLTDIDQNQVNAVKYRQELDLRIGCTLTNFQTIEIKKQYDTRQRSPLTYGTCQLPLLSIIVDDYLERKNFKPKKFYEMAVCCTHEQSPEDLWFNWSGEPIDQIQKAEQIYDCFPDNYSIFLTVKEVKKYRKKKLRPLPLTTSTLLKQVTSRFKMSSSVIMYMAYELYKQGLISYPRTYTNRFHPSINLTYCVSNLLKHPRLGGVAKKLLEKGVHPRFGNQNDQAHSPIYPLKVSESPLEGQMGIIHEVVVYNFLLCLSYDAEYDQTTITIEHQSGLLFDLTGNVMINEGYLEHTMGKEKIRCRALPYLKEGDRLPLKKISMKEKYEQPPPKLTYSALITKMEERKIGTDSTIHEHIKNIQERQYAIKESDEFKPTKLGASLVNAYRQINSELCNPLLRAYMEENVKKIAKGELNYTKALEESLKTFEKHYEELEAKKKYYLRAFNYVFKSSYKSQYTDQYIVYSCTKCQGNMYINYQERTLGCTKCQIAHSLPKYGKIYTMDYKCYECSSQLLTVRRDKSTYTICPECFSNPKPHMHDRPTQRLPCFECIVQKCKFSKAFKYKGLYRCGYCQKKNITVKQSRGNIFLGCLGFPACRATTKLNKNIYDIVKTNKKCYKCYKYGRYSWLCDITTKSEYKSYEVCMYPGCSQMILRQFQK